MPPYIPHLDNALQQNRVVNSYNGFPFPPAVSMTCQIEPIMESSGRLPKYWKHTITIEFMVTSATLPQDNDFTDTPVDFNVETLKRLLTVPGKPLILSRRGLGFTTTLTNGSGTDDYTVNSTNDLQFGPRPVLLLWEPVGASQAVRIQWSVEFHLAVCCYADLDSDGYCDNAGVPINNTNYLTLIDFSYSLSFSVDEEGWTVRSIVGSAMIPGRLLQNLALMPGADATSSTPNTSLMLNLNQLQARLQQLFPRFPKFHRDWQWDTSRDGTRIDFRITDKEIHSDNPFMPGIINCEMDHEISSQLPFYKWSCALTGSFTIQAGYSRDTGWTMFLIVLRSRLQRLQLATGELMQEFNDNGNLTREKRPTVPTFFPQRISLRESLMSRKSSFSFEYMIFCPLDKILRASGLFQPIPGDWTLWTATLRPELFTGRGIQDMAAAGYSNIITVCTNPTPLSNNGTINGRNELLTLEKFFTTTCPPVNKSWIDYKIWFEEVSEASYALHQKTYAASVSGFKESPGNNQRTDQAAPNPASQLDELLTSNDPNRYNVYQPTTGYKHYVIMKGYAIRACYNIPVPSLQSYGKNGNVIHVNTVTEERVLGGSGPVIFWGRTWQRLYILPVPYGSANPTTNLKTNGVPAHYMDQEQVGDIIQEQ